MSAVKWSPGPWGIGASKQEVGYDACGRWCVLATCPSLGLGLADESRALHEAQANARLISAAPDMYEALKAVLRAPCVGSDGPGSTTLVVQDFVLRGIKAAIRKAEGGAS